MEESKTNESTKGRGKIENQQGLYSRLASRAPEVIEKLFECLQSRNQAISLGAAKIIINKVLPDLKSVEVGGGLDEHGRRQPIQIYINTGAGFVPASLQLPSSSTGSTTTGTTAIQDPSVAPTSTENNDSDNGNSETKPA